MRSAAKALVAVFAPLMLAVPARADEKQILVAVGERLRVVDSGAGDAIVLVPGLLESAFAFRKLSALLLGAGYRVVVVEPLGFGGSGRPKTADYSLTAQADRIAAALEGSASSPRSSSHTRWEGPWHSALPADIRSE